MAQEKTPTTPSTQTTRSAASASSAQRRPSTASAAAEAVHRRRGCLSTPFLVFLGSLLGSLLGVGANIADILGSIEQVEGLFNPRLTLCLVGSNTILGEGIHMAADWKQEFETTHHVSVEIDGVGSVRGVEQAAAGQCVHVLAMSEPMTRQQYDQLSSSGVTIDCAAEVGYDVIAFVTNIDNQTPTIGIRDLDEILTGEIRDWSQVGGSRTAGRPQPIYILARPGSGTTDFVLINVARYTDPNLNDDQYFPPNTNYIPCPSNEACLDLTLSTPGSLYWVSTAWMRTQPPEYLRVIPILRGDERPINPLTQEVDLDEYPVQLIRPLYLYVLGSASISPEANQAAREFLTYVRSVRGQVVLERYAFYTHFDQPTDLEIPMPPGFTIPVDGPRQICR